MRAATEIQNIQIGDGNVAKDFEIPIYMVFPRLFTCPSLQTDTFKIGACQTRPRRRHPRRV